MTMYDWEELTNTCKNCKKCRLSNMRKNVVIERGNRNAPLMLIGEGPGEQEDIQGQPFVGRAGKLLDLLLDALMIKEHQYYITNISKMQTPRKQGSLVKMKPRHVYLI